MRTLYFLIGILFFGSFLEMLGISMIVSVCSLMMAAQKQRLSVFARWCGKWLGIRLGEEAFPALIVVLILIYLFKALYLILENYLQVRFVRSCKQDISVRLFKSILNSPYERFTKSSAAKITSLLTFDVNKFTNYLNDFLLVITECLVMVCMTAFLIITNPVMTLFIEGGILIVLFSIRCIIRKRIYQIGLALRKANASCLKWSNQAVHGIKDVKVSQTENFFFGRYCEASAERTRLEYQSKFWYKLPNVCIESILIISILLYILFMLTNGFDMADFFPNLSALALSAVRILPACSRINATMTRMSSGKASLEAVRMAVLEEESMRKEEYKNKNKDENKNTELVHDIELKNIFYQYDGRQEPVLENVSMKIPAGSSVGIVGTSGVGKTTLVDVLLGLLCPQKGKVMSDGVDIRECYESYLGKIAYIPQMIFMLDDTIRNNVARGASPGEISDERVWEALKQAALYELVKTLPEGLDTQIGERGIRLSGGERQRLGFARALYRDCPVMVFDESTSALDVETEAAIMESIRRMNGKKTMIIISHRPSAVAACEKIYKVEDGRITEASGER